VQPVLDLSAGRAEDARRRHLHAARRAFLRRADVRPAPSLPGRADNDDKQDWSPSSWPEPARARSPRAVRRIGELHHALAAAS